MRTKTNHCVRISCGRVIALYATGRDWYQQLTELFVIRSHSLYFNTLFNWHINLTIDGTIYPSQHFPFGAAFVCQAGNFWTILRTLNLWTPDDERNGRSKHVDLQKDCRINTYRKCILLVCLCNWLRCSVHTMSNRTIYWWLLVISLMPVFFIEF